VLNGYVTPYPNPNRNQINQENPKRINLKNWEKTSRQFDGWKRVTTKWNLTNLRMVQIRPIVCECNKLPYEMNLKSMN
jgi:hypothetical protein